MLMIIRLIRFHSTRIPQRGLIESFSAGTEDCSRKQNVALTPSSRAPTNSFEHVRASELSQISQKHERIFLPNAPLYVSAVSQVGFFFLTFRHEFLVSASLVRHSRIPYWTLLALATLARSRTVPRKRCGPEIRMPF